MSIPRDLDDDSLQRLARSFFVVKMARYAGLLVAALAIGALALGEGAPGWVPVGLAVLAVVLAVAMAATAGRYRRRAGSSPRP